MRTCVRACARYARTCVFVWVWGSTHTEIRPHVVQSRLRLDYIARMALVLLFPSSRSRVTWSLFFLWSSLSLSLSAPGSVWLAPHPKCCVYWLVLLPQLGMQWTSLGYESFYEVTIFDGKKVCHYQVLHSKYKTMGQFHVAHIKCKSKRRMRNNYHIHHKICALRTEVTKATTLRALHRV